MKNMYLGSLTALAVISSSMVHAEQIATAPTLEGGITASVGTFLVTPSADNAFYAYQFNEDGTQVSGLQAVPGYDFGIDAALGYIFDETANGIELSFRNISTSDDDSAESGQFTQDPTDEFFGPVDANIGYELNSFDLMISQFLDIGQTTQVRLLAGLAYAEIEQNQNNNLYPIDSPEGIDHISVDKHSEFRGWGPRMGIDVRYDFGDGFGIVGGGTVAYLLGDLDADGTVRENGDVDPLNPDKIADTDSHNVTNFRGNLGVDYVYYFKNQDLPTLGLELGYLVDYYDDAISDAEFLNTYSVTFSGPYVNLKGVF